MDTSDESSSKEGRASEARARWRILKHAILQSRKPAAAGHTDQVDATSCSVRSFSTFKLFSVVSDDDKEHLVQELGPGPEQGRWCKYSYDCVEARIRLLTGPTSLEAMVGFNNTGNVCVWPSEEVLAYYCLKHSELFSGKSVCELGCGMTALAGVMVACSSLPKEVVLTDGNKESVENVASIVECNTKQFGHTTVSADIVQWQDEPSHSPYKGRFDLVVCSDCLFFEDVHAALCSLMLIITAHDGCVVIFAPKRGTSLERFIAVAREHFSVECNEVYDDVVWKAHQEQMKLDSKLYNPNLHYPVQLIMHPLRITQ